MHIKRFIQMTQERRAMREGMDVGKPENVKSFMQARDVSVAKDEPRLNDQRKVKSSKAGDANLDRANTLPGPSQPKKPALNREYAGARPVTVKRVGEGMESSDALRGHTRRHSASSEQTSQGWRTVLERCCKLFAQGKLTEAESIHLATVLRAHGMADRISQVTRPTYATRPVDLQLVEALFRLSHDSAGVVLAENAKAIVATLKLERRNANEWAGFDPEAKRFVTVLKLGERFLVGLGDGPARVVVEGLRERTDEQSSEVAKFMRSYTKVNPTSVQRALSLSEGWRTTSKWAGTMVREGFIDKTPAGVIFVKRPDGLVEAAIGVLGSPLPLYELFGFGQAARDRRRQRNALSTHALTSRINAAPMGAAGTDAAQDRMDTRFAPNYIGHHADDGLAVGYQTRPDGYLLRVGDAARQQHGQDVVQKIDMDDIKKKAQTYAAMARMSMDQIAKMGAQKYADEIGAARIGQLGRDVKIEPSLSSAAPVSAPASAPAAAPATPSPNVASAGTAGGATASSPTGASSTTTTTRNASPQTRSVDDADLKKMGEDDLSYLVVAQRDEIDDDTYHRAVEELNRRARRKYQVDMARNAGMPGSDDDVWQGDTPDDWFGVEDPDEKKRSPIEQHATAQFRNPENYYASQTGPATMRDAGWNADKLTAPSMPPPARQEPKASPGATAVSDVLDDAGIETTEPKKTARVNARKADTGLATEEQYRDLRNRGFSSDFIRSLDNKKTIEWLIKNKHIKDPTGSARMSGTNESANTMSSKHAASYQTFPHKRRMKRVPGELPKPVKETHSLASMRRRWV